MVRRSRKRTGSCYNQKEGKEEKGRQCNEVGSTSEEREKAPIQVNWQLDPAGDKNTLKEINQDDREGKGIQVKATQ